MILATPILAQEDQAEAISPSEIINSGGTASQTRQASSLIIPGTDARESPYDRALAPTATQAEGLVEVVPTDILELESYSPPIQRSSSRHLDQGAVLADDSPKEVQFGDWLGYNATQSDTTWLTGNGDEFGMYSMESFPTLKVGTNSSLMLGTGFHFLNGPVATDMPPRLFDFQLAYQRRKAYSHRLMLDTKVGVGAFSDFEGSARKGIRFPSHAVGYYQWDPWLVSVLGIEFLDRDDVNLLPVVGFVWRQRDDIVAELVFPRPRIQIKIRDNRALYLSGELGGGTWAIERVSDLNDNVSYRDLRLMLGVVKFGDQDDSDSALEIGWAFSRALEYRSALGNYHPDDTFILRFRQHY
ncbi:MAG: hypothetical protein R3C53_08575 [Pirellulaceae bacterium]